MRSFSELQDQAAITVQPAKVELVKLTREMTLAQFNAQYPSSIPIEELAIINELEGPDSAIPAGRTVKRVVGGASGKRPDSFEDPVPHGTGEPPGIGVLPTGRMKRGDQVRLPSGTWSRSPISRLLGRLAAKPVATMPGGAEPVLATDRF